MKTITRNLRKRVQALESALLPVSVSRPDPAGDEQIMALAKLRVSDEDRELCERLLQPPELRVARTERDSQAVRAYLSAIWLECQRAGYRSFDDFQASYCGRQ